MCAQTPSALTFFTGFTAPTALSASSTPPPPSALRPATVRCHHHHPHCPHRSPLPLSPTGRPLFGSFRSLEASNVCPNPRRPHRPHRPHCPHRSPPSLLGHCPYLGLCHCPHLAALGSGFEVFQKCLGASNVCPNPLRPHRPHHPHRPHRPHRPQLPSTPIALSASPATLRCHHHHPHCPHRSPPSFSAIVR